MSPAFQKQQDLILVNHAKSQCQQRGEIQPGGAGSQRGRVMSAERTVWKGLVRHRLACCLWCVLGCFLSPLVPVRLETSKLSDHKF